MPAAAKVPRGIAMEDVRMEKSRQVIAAAKQYIRLDWKKTGVLSLCVVACLWVPRAVILLLPVRLPVYAKCLLYTAVFLLRGCVYCAVADVLFYRQVSVRRMCRALTWGKSYACALSSSFVFVLFVQPFFRDTLSLALGGENNPYLLSLGIVLSNFALFLGNWVADTLLAPLVQKDGDLPWGRILRANMSRLFPGIWLELRLAVYALPAIALTWIITLLCVRRGSLAGIVQIQFWGVTVMYGCALVYTPFQLMARYIGYHTRVAIAKEVSTHVAV